MEERVASKHVVAMCNKPVVDLSLLSLSRVQFIPRICTTSRRTQARDTELSAVAIGKLFESIKLINVVSGHDYRNFERPEVCITQVVHCSNRCVERTFTTYCIICCTVNAVHADLNIEVVHGSKALRIFCSDVCAVGGKLHANVVVLGMFKNLEEVFANHWLAATDVYVEHLQVA